MDDHFAKALQNALQYPAVLPRTGSQATLPALKKTPVLKGLAAGCEVVHTGRVEGVRSTDCIDYNNTARSSIERGHLPPVHHEEPDDVPTLSPSMRLR